MNPRFAQKQVSAGLRDSPPSEFLVWQLADSAFPTGGFAHSAGLEAAWQYGEVRNRAELGTYVEVSLHQFGFSGLPFVTAAHEHPEQLDEFDRFCDAFTTNHVANRASRIQGRAFVSAVDRIFQTASSGQHDHGRRLPFAHFAPVFGAMLCDLDVPMKTATRMFLFNHLRGLLAAAVRLNILGPMEAQTLQHHSTPRVEEIRIACATLTLDDVAQTSPLLDIWQGAQDRLYSRLFQS
jgi:urease accessory protein